MSDEQKDLMYLLTDDEDDATAKALANDTEKGDKTPQMNMQNMMMKIPPDFEKADIHGVS